MLRVRSSRFVADGEISFLVATESGRPWVTGASEWDATGERNLYVQDQEAGATARDRVRSYSGHKQRGRGWCVLTGHRPSPPREKSRWWRPLFRAGETEVAGDASTVAFISPARRLQLHVAVGIRIVSGETLCATPTHGHVSSLLLRTAGLAGSACG